MKHDAGMKTTGNKFALIAVPVVLALGGCLNSDSNDSHGSNEPMSFADLGELLSFSDLQDLDMELSNEFFPGVNDPKPGDAPDSSLTGEASYAGMARFLDVTENADLLLSQVGLVADFNEDTFTGQMYNFFTNEGKVISGDLRLELVDDMIEPTGEMTIHGTLDGDKPVSGNVLYRLGGTNAEYFTGMMTGTYGGQGFGGGIIAKDDSRTGEE